MKRHLLGFALFVLIVGTAVFVRSMFRTATTVKVSVPNYSLTSPATSCWKMKATSRTNKSTAPISIGQAVFNLDRKQIKLELQNASEMNNFPTVLHFFQKDVNGIKYIASEPVLLVVYDSNKTSYGGVNTLTASYDWLYNLDSYANLYVITGYAPMRGVDDKNFQPEFDASHAVPVMLDYGK